MVLALGEACRILPDAPPHGETEMGPLNVDLTLITAIWMGGSVLLVPLAGLTARFGLKPLLESVARVRAAGREAQGGAEAQARFDALEARLAELAAAVERLASEPRGERRAA